VHLLHRTVLSRHIGDGDTALARYHGAGRALTTPIIALYHQGIRRNDCQKQ